MPDIHNKELAERILACGKAVDAVMVIGTNPQASMDELIRALLEVYVAGQLAHATAVLHRARQLEQRP